MKQVDCVGCGAVMRFLVRESIQLGKTGWILGDIPNLIAGALKVDIYICPSCQRLAFFAAEEGKQDGFPTKACPRCGCVHDFDYPKCPKCKHDYYDGE